MLTIGAARGFTLPEALLAIVITAAGLAGSALMLLQTVKQERESGSHRAAIRIAASMADQLRAIRRPDGRPVLAITGVDPVTACVDQPASCAPERAAAQMRITWSVEAAYSLPQGAMVEVAIPDPLVPEYLISIDWPATGSGMLHLRLPVTT